MYEKLDPDYIKQVKRERRGKFELTDYLPNTLKQDRSFGSISNEGDTSVGSGIITKSRYGKGGIHEHSKAQLGKTFQGSGKISGTINRLASLTEIDSDSRNGFY